MSTDVSESVTDLQIGIRKAIDMIVKLSEQNSELVARLLAVEAENRKLKVELHNVNSVIDTVGDNI